MHDRHAALTHPPVLMDTLRQWAPTCVGARPPVIPHVPPCDRVPHTVLAEMLRGRKAGKEVSVRKEASFQSGQIVQVGSAGRPGSANRKRGQLGPEGRMV